MEAVRKRWQAIGQTRWISDSRPTVRSPDLRCQAMLLNKHVRMCLALRRSLAFSTTRRSTSGTRAPTAAAINASNPCSEYMFLDDTACNLASHQLDEVPLTKDGTFDVGAIPCRLPGVFIAQEILVDHASYPTEDDCSKQPSVPSAGAWLFQLGQPDDVNGLAYDSDAGRGVCGAITALVARFGQSHQCRAGRSGGAVCRVRAKRRTDVAA